MRQCSVVHRGLYEHVRYATRLDTSDVENRLRQKSDAVVFKQHVSGKSDVLKYFSLMFEKRREDSDALTSVETLNNVHITMNKRSTRY